MTALFGTSTVGANLLFEFQTGAHERMLVTPLSRPSLLIGRALKEMVPLAGQAVIIVLVMIPFGFDAVPGRRAASGLLLLAVFGIGLGSLSYALAIAVRKQEWMFWVVQQTLLFPLMILSGMLLPLETGPGGCRSRRSSTRWPTWSTRSGRCSPATSLSTAVLWGWVAALVTAAVGLTVGIRAMLRSAD